MSRAPIILRIVAPKHRAKLPVDSCRHFRSGSQPLSCLPCRREPLIGGKHRAPRHRADVPVDRCGEGWQAIPCRACANYAIHSAAHRAEVPA